MAQKTGGKARDVMMMKREKIHKFFLRIVDGVKLKFVYKALRKTDSSIRRWRCFLNRIQFDELSTSSRESVWEWDQRQQPKPMKLPWFSCFCVCFIESQRFSMMYTCGRVCGLIKWLNHPRLNIQFYQVQLAGYEKEPERERERVGAFISRDWCNLMPTQTTLFMLQLTSTHFAPLIRNTHATHPMIYVVVVQQILSICLLTFSNAWPLHPIMICL